MNNKFEFSVVVPCYNEIKSLPYIIDGFEAAKGNVQLQLVVVNNGSSDGSYEYLEEKLSNYNFLKVVHIQDNIGLGYGLKQGILNCDAEIIGITHGDLQISAEDVLKVYDLFKEKDDLSIIVKGHRNFRNWKSLVFTYGLIIYTSLLLFKMFDDINSPPKIFHKSLMEKMRKSPNGFCYELFLLNVAKSNNYKTYQYDINYCDRRFGVSTWSYSLTSKMKTISQFLIDVLKIRLGVYK